MFRVFVPRIVPVVAPVVGVVCIGSYLRQEYLFQTRDRPPKTERIEPDDEYYKKVMFRYFHH